MNPKAFTKINTPYAELPWYRRRWFILLSLLLFTPVAVVVALTGDVYAQSKGQTYVFTDRQRNQILYLAAMFFFVGIVSALGRG
jgi:hypothetical protein